jgi:hypothetical protein
MLVGEGGYGSAMLVVGKVEYFHIGTLYHLISFSFFARSLIPIDKSLYRDGEFDFSSLETISRLGGLSYGNTKVDFEVANGIWSKNNW